MSAFPSLNADGQPRDVLVQATVHLDPDKLPDIFTARTKEGATNPTPRLAQKPGTLPGVKVIDNLRGGSATLLIADLQKMGYGLQRVNAHRLDNKAKNSKFRFTLGFVVNPDSVFEDTEGMAFLEAAIIGGSYVIGGTVHVTTPNPDYVIAEGEDDNRAVMVTVINPRRIKENEPGHPLRVDKNGFWIQDHRDSSGSKEISVEAANQLSFMFALGTRVRAVVESKCYKTIKNRRPITETMRVDALKAARTEVGDVMRDFGRVWDASFASKIVGKVGENFDKTVEKARARFALTVVERSLRTAIKDGRALTVDDYIAIRATATDAILPSMEEGAGLLIATLFTDEVMAKLVEKLTA